MKLIKGSDLTPEQQREVLAHFPYRLTHENNYPRVNPCRATVPAVSDQQWLKEHAFYYTERGKLSQAHTHCEPAWTANRPAEEIAQLAELEPPASQSEEGAPFRYSIEIVVSQVNKWGEVVDTHTITGPNFASSNRAEVVKVAERLAYQSEGWFQHLPDVTPLVIQ